MTSHSRKAETKPFSPWTPGLVLGVFFYLAAILALYHLGQRTGTNTAPSLLYQVFALKCPLCGGTRASLALLGGEFVEALRWNPLVTLTLPGVILFALAKGVFRTELTIPLPVPLLVCCGTLLVAINWAYVLSSSSPVAPDSPPALRYLLHQWMQR